MQINHVTDDEKKFLNVEWLYHTMFFYKCSLFVIQFNIDLLQIIKCYRKKISQRRRAVRVPDVHTSSLENQQTWLEDKKPVR